MNPFTKAVITSIDTDTGTCKCRGEIGGAIIINVGIAKPIGSNSAIPQVGDRVALWNDNGQYWALFVLDQLSAEKPYAPPISVAGDTPVTFPDSTAISEGLNISNSGSVTGTIPGDKVLAAKGGAVVAALTGGGVLLRASALCQVVMSKVDDVFKVIARNYEKFTESHSVVSANVLGRTYHFEETYEDQVQARAGVPSHKVLRGDVEAAEALGLNFRAGDPVAPVGDVISRETVEIPGDMRVYEKDLNKDGSTRERIWKSGEDDTLVETKTVATYNLVIDTGDDNLVESKTATTYTLTLDNGMGAVESIDITHTHLKLANNSGACYLEFLPGGVATLYAGTDISLTSDTSIHLAAPLIDLTADTKIKLTAPLISTNGS